MNDREFRMEKINSEREVFFFRRTRLRWTREFEERGERLNLSHNEFDPPNKFPVERRPFCFYACIPTLVSFIYTQDGRTYRDIFISPEIIFLANSPSFSLHSFSQPV